MRRVLNLFQRLVRDPAPGRGHREVGMDRELLFLLDDYLNGTMEDGLRQDLERHLVLCPSTASFLASRGGAGDGGSRIRAEEVPPDVVAWLRAFVAENRQGRSRELEVYVRQAAEERQQEAASLIRDYCARRLPPSMAFLFESHRDRCPKCGGFLRGLRRGHETPPASKEVAEHIAEFSRPLRRRRLSA
jgi:hypothetical protein